MGNQTPPPKAKKMSVEDNIIEMKIQSKQIARQAKKSQKQQVKYQKQAKDALKKNNQQGAKMYLMSAASKRAEALNYERMAIKMQFMCDKIKSMKTNQQLMNSFGTMTQIVNQQMNTFDSVKMMENMETFNTKMDDMMIQNKMINEITNQNEFQTDAVVDDMKNALMNEIAMEENNKMMEQQQKQDIIYQQQNQGFMDELKDL